MEEQKLSFSRTKLRELTFAVREADAKNDPGARRNVDMIVATGGVCSTYDFTCSKTDTVCC